MNKKRLSVVMAGAMLASSVAPVLAATPSYEVNGSNKGILIRDLRNLLTSKVYANIADNNSYAGQSVYEVKVGSTYYHDVTEAGIKALEEALKAADKDTVISVSDRGFAEKNGKYYAYALEEVSTTRTFGADELKGLALAYNMNTYPAVKSMDYSEADKTLTVVTRKAESEDKLWTLTFKEGDKAVDFTKPIDDDKNLINGTHESDWSNLAGFKESARVTTSKGDKLVSKLLANVTISNADEIINFKLSDLYDGLLLTEKGQELLDAAKMCKSDANDGYKYSVGQVDSIANGLFTLDINFYDQNEVTNKKVKKVVKITTNNKAQLELFRKWMVDAKAQVEVLAGDNRYETAVKVAKENASIKDVATNGNIVLVNGNSLVDGLAAAPLAASVINLDNDGNWWGDNDKVAPILLTESDSIPKATKDYIRELIKYQTVGNLDKVTVYLVGGESVISKSLENELKDLGLRIVRAGGKDREATSLEVAKLMEKENGEYFENAFLVGANGEADAMSIASVAAKKRQPIIVESPKGVSEDTIEFLHGYKSSLEKSATIIGGESVVSKATEETLKAEKIAVDRIAGSNRQNTNAEIINRFAPSGLKQIVISKDGVAKKSELIDALTATSLAVKDNAPIVLGTNKLNENQINAIEKKAQRTGIYVYQVGHGVARDVLKQIATRVGLVK